MLQTFDFTGISEQEVQQMIKDFQSKIDWITSGRRARYEAEKKREENLNLWGRALSKELKDANLISHRNTSYSHWEYSIKNTDLNFNIPYTLMYGDLDKTKDFVAIIYKFNCVNRKYELLAKIHSASEFIEFITEYQTTIISQS